MQGQEGLQAKYHQSDIGKIGLLRPQWLNLESQARPFQWRTDVGDPYAAVHLLLQGENRM